MMLRICVSLVAALLSACISTPPKPDDPEYSPVISAAATPKRISEGTLYRGGTAMSLYNDRKAMRIGDILTIELSERTISSKKAETEIKKENDIAIDIGQIAGVVPSYGNYSLNTGVTNDRDFNGSADAGQANSLVGSIAVTVADILPNGLLVVRGEKWMTLTNGDEYIRVKGLVRPEDIGPYNTISSTKLADARISYSGTGDLADANQQGWLSRFFGSPYWPF